jgi:hypothetical protein
MIRLCAALGAMGGAALAQNAAPAPGTAPLRRTPGVAACVRALDLAPPDAISVCVAPDAKLLGDDMAELASKFERMHALTEMKPLDLVKSRFGIGPGMDDRGAFVAWYAPSKEPSPPWCALIPTTDSAKFLQSNLEAAPEVAPDAYRKQGMVYYAKAVDGFVAVSPSAELARGYARKPGLAERLKSRLGERGFAVLCDGDVAMWAGPEALADLRRNGRAQAAAMEAGRAGSGAKPEAAAGAKDAAKPVDPAERFAHLMEGLTDGVTSVDVDPLGVLVRSYAVLDPASDLGRSARGGAAHAGASLDHLPRGAFVLALAADVAGLGGMQAFLDLAALIPGGDQVPSWLAQNKDLVTSLQMGIYPSKLGLMGGGVLNEAVLWLGATDGAKAKSVIELWMASLAGEADGQKREVTWEKDRALKSGVVADAYLVKDIPLPRNGQPARRVNPMERMLRTIVYGPKGPNGFVKSSPDGVLVTFSQRPDVLERAVAVTGDGNSLQREATITALRSWLMPRPDAVAFVGVGSLLNVVRQAASAFPGAGIEIPDAPPSLEPIAFGMAVDGGRIETATMIPAGVISVGVTAYADRRDAQRDEGGDAPAAKDDDEAPPRAPGKSAAPSASPAGTPPAPPR